MWPQSAEEWFHYWEAETVSHVKGRLLHFPILRGFADRLAAQAVARAHEVANYLRQYPGYFEPGKPYSRWLRGVGYREALRLVLQPEPVEAILQGLNASARWHLRLRYIDQLNDDETARVLDLRSTGPSLFDAAAARTQSLGAYTEFHRALERRSAAGKVGFAVLFPMFPNTASHTRSHETRRGLS